MEKDKTRVDEKDFPDWTVEEFDAIEEDHVFSARCYRMMKRMLRERENRKGRRFPFAAAAVAACLMLSVGVFAAVSHGEFFQNAFGDAGRKSAKAQEVVLDDGQGGQYTVTYPKKEYVTADEEKAEALIGAAVYEGPLAVEVGDHTVTIDSAVRDEQAIVMEFSVTCDTGVKVFDLNEQNDQAKGQNWSDDAPFFFGVEGALGDIYVDFERMTETSVHGYYYGLFMTDGLLAKGETPVLSIGSGTGREVSYKRVEIPAADTLERTAFTSAEGGYLELSPIGLTVDMARGLGLAKEEFDSADVESIVIEYKDGSVYRVFDKAEELENYASLCVGGTSYTRQIDENGNLGDPMVTYRNTGLALAFNRLVDPAGIRSITVNGIVYTAE